MLAVRRAAACVAAMIAINVALFHGGAFVLVFAPVGWFGWNEVRLHHLRRALDRAAGKR